MVRDAHGRKMSKSLGNVIDPTFVINGQWAVPGAQESDTFVKVIRRLADKVRSEPLTPVTDAGAACEDDACDV